MSSHKNQAGFTLLELLIAMVIVSMVMTTAFAAIRIGNRSWEAGYERSDSIEEMRSFAEFLRRQMGQAVAATWQEEDDPRIAFTGKQRLVRFVAPAPFESDRVGLLTYALIFDNQMDNSTLRLEYAAYDPGATDFRASPTANEIAFTATFQSVALDYYGPVDMDSRETWYSEWPASAEMLPKLVRIRFTPNDEGVGWPDLVVPLYSRQTL
jgi:general secretion pathway protein J